MNDTHITHVVGRRVWDSRGRPTVEAEIQLAGGAVGQAIAPAGASTGSAEAVDLRDADGFGVATAVAGVNGDIAAALIGLDASDQAPVDTTLIELDGTPNKARLGGNACIAVSMACAWAAAGAAELPLWHHLAGAAMPRIPLPEIQIFGGGAHAGRRVDVQDFMVMAPGASSLDQALEWTSRVYHSAGQIMAERGRLRGVADEGGFWPAFDSNEQALETLLLAIEQAGFTPGDEVVISLDVAASEFGGQGRYRLGLEGRELDSDGLSEMLLGWIERYPITAIEDPLAEDDAEALVRFTAAVGPEVQVVGDDFLVTSATRVTAAAASGACNTLLVKPNQAGTLSETKAALDAARSAGWGTIVSARSGETEDVTIAHLAVGWDAGQIKVGSFARSERMAKWNELLRIEASMEKTTRFARRVPNDAINRLKAATKDDKTSTAAGGLNHPKQT